MAPRAGDPIRDHSYVGPREHRGPPSPRRCVRDGPACPDPHRSPRAVRERVRTRRDPRRRRMVDGVSERPLIPLVELVKHYRDFKSTRDGNGVLVPGPYRGQAARVQLAQSYIDNPDELTSKFVRSVKEFSSYDNLDEAFIGT